MSWGRIAFYYLLLAAACAWYYTVTTNAVRSRGEDGDVQTLLNVALDDLTEVRLVDKDRRVRFRSEGGRWKIVEPDGQAPADLLRSFVTTVIESRPAEVVAEDDRREADYGLGPDALRIELYERGHEKPIRVWIGNRNPTETAVYARVEGRPEILLVGRVLQYYAERIFEEAARRPEAGPPPTIDLDRAERTAQHHAEAHERH